LVCILGADGFHLEIRGEKPNAYPPRLRVLIDEAPWSVECPDYQPPYYVDAAVLANNSADPEDFSRVSEGRSRQDAARRDNDGRPLNPRGRTGVAGRGLLDLWGANQMVGAVIIRTNPETSTLEVLLGKLRSNAAISLPMGFVSRSEATEAALREMLEASVGFQPENEGEVISEGYSYDARQTDHAWIELEARLYNLDAESRLPTLRSSADFEEIEWWPVDPDTVNQLPPSQSRLVREAVRHLMERGIAERDWALGVLAKTG